MNILTRRSVVRAVPIGLLWVALASPVLAGVSDYEFQLVQSEVKKGDGAIVAVRLVNKRSGKTVPDAVISAKRIDMAPDGMAAMAAPLEQLPSTEPGVYRFKADLSDARSLAAFTGRKGAGRDRDGRKQTCPQGRAVKRLVWSIPILAALVAAGIGGYRIGRHELVVPSIDRRSCRSHGKR